MNNPAFLLLTLCASALSAANSENVLLVVNANSRISINIAEYYTSRRAVPRSNLCAIRTVEEETVSREVFDRSIEEPIRKCLLSGRLKEKILYIVTTQGVPLRIRGRTDTNGDYASVDSELTLLYLVLSGRRHSNEGPLPNPFYRQRDADFRHPHFPLYLVTRLAAYDLAEVKRMVDRCLAARNHGKFVIDLRDGEDDGGDQWLRNAAILLPAGRVILDETKAVLYGQKQVIGYASWGSNDKSRKQRNLGFEWLPGAIATEFVSTDGRTFSRPPAAWNLGTWSDRRTWFVGSPQSMAADFIAAGASGSSGHVDEPYLAYTPRPDYLLPAYYSGRNLAESYYLAIPALSWQNIVIGDPLCSLGPPR